MRAFTCESALGPPGSALGLAPLLLLIATLVATGCAHEASKPFVKDTTLQVSATVEAVNPVTRMVMMRGPNGPASIVAGPQVQNFDQIRVGDKVTVTYYAGMAAQLNKSGAPAPADADGTKTYIAPLGAKPAAGVGQAISTTVKIESVDTSFDTVTFKRPDGFMRTVAVESADGKKFIRTLKPGDSVDVVYTEAVAVQVTPGE